ncbi:MAG: hypothetical protein CM15mP84_01010 [Cellvibrionales bacterium]|nr:MAG: hypothetical protein CM15mP84_01010 [Cellvibrionales bacterium]
MRQSLHAKWPNTLDLSLTWGCIRGRLAGTSCIALTVGVEEGAGLHNIAATLQSPSPEFADLPTTELGVPDFSRMTPAQRESFVDLCRIDRESRKHLPKNG